MPKSRRREPAAEPARAPRVSPDIAAEIARHLVERSALSIFDPGTALDIAIGERWPHASETEIQRAVRIFVEIRSADDNFTRFGQQPRFGEPPRP